MGQVVASDRDSYQYLVESIRKFPDQERFAGDDPRRRVRAGEIPQPVDGHRRAAFGLEDLGARTAQHLAADPHRRHAGAHRRDGRRAGGVRRAAARCGSWRASLAGRSSRLGYTGDPALPPATRALTALGPAYIKFGQILSTRPDVVGDELADAAARCCRTSCRPFPTEVAQARGRARAGACRSTRRFREFSEPVAAASIAQVHRARLADTGEHGRGEGAAPRDRARLPHRYRRLLLRRPA